MRQERQNYRSRYVKGPYCPFKKKCIFLHGENPSHIITERDYLSKRVDKLELVMNIGNNKILKLQERIKELEDTNSQLKTELSEALKDPFNKYKRKETEQTSKKAWSPSWSSGMVS